MKGTSMSGWHRRGALLATVLLALPLNAPAPATGFELVEPEAERSVSMIVGTGQLIRVDSEFSSLFVANPEVADIEVKSPRLLYLTGVGVGETTLFAVDDLDNVLMAATIQVTHNTTALKRGFERVAPGQPISALTVDQSLVISGAVKTPEQAADVMQVAAQFVDDPAQLVNRMDVATPTQVNLEVRIAEVNRNVDRRLGIRWNAVGVSSNGRWDYAATGGGITAADYAARIGYFGSRINIDVLLQALSEEGMVTILAEPNLTARSGENASFLAGGEFPYTVRQDDDSNTIEFKDFGIGLNFTPTVLNGERISLMVGTEVSELNFSTNPDVPSLTTRRAETTVDLSSGQSFAIAGLMQNDSSQNASRVPGLGEVPVLGALFKSTGYQRQQTELVIIVTPVVVRPQAPQRVKSPTARYVPPNDFERILFGRFQGKPAQVDQLQNRMRSRRLFGPSGFVFE